MTTQYKLQSVRIDREPTLVAKIDGDYVLNIPFDPANTDYQAFLKYQAEGGKVYGADEEVPADEVTG